MRRRAAALDGTDGRAKIRQILAGSAGRSVNYTVTYKPRPPAVGGSVSEIYGSAKAALVGIDAMEATSYEVVGITDETGLVMFEDELQHEARREASDMGRPKPRGAV